MQTPKIRTSLNWAADLSYFADVAALKWWSKHERKREEKKRRAKKERGKKGKEEEKVPLRGSYPGPLTL